MNVIKYCCPFQDVVGNGPQMFVCISFNTFEHLLPPNFLITTRKWRFSDAKKDVDTKNVRIRVFPTLEACVGQPPSRIGQIKLKIHLIPDAMQSALGTTSSIRGFLDTP